MMVSKNRALDTTEQLKQRELRQRLKEVTDENKRRWDDDKKRESLLQKEAERSLASIQIGNPEEEGLRRHSNRKDLLEFYSRHMQEKRQKELQEKQHDKELLSKQQSIQERRELERQLEHERRIQSHQQNPDVFRYYNSLNELGHLRERQLEAKLIDQAAQERLRKEDERARRDGDTKSRLMEDVRKSLLQQIQSRKDGEIEQRRQRSQETNANPFQGEIPDGRGYDKEEYLAFLKKQEEIARKRKQQEKDMNPLEYQMNLQDLKVTSH